MDKLEHAIGPELGAIVANGLAGEEALVQTVITQGARGFGLGQGTLPAVVAGGGAMLEDDAQAQQFGKICQDVASP